LATTTPSRWASTPAFDIGMFVVSPMANPLS